jgi:hypothetical protein
MTRFVWIGIVDLLIQVGLRCIPMLSRLLYPTIPGGFRSQSDQRYVGILSNGFDNFSYAAWAAQAENGALVMLNLYTTEPHAAYLFNPYFLIIGKLAILTHAWPLTVMVILGIAAVPLLIIETYYLGASLRLSKKATFVAILLILFATGPSIILDPVNGAMGLAHIGVRVPPGIDSYYFDLFPATTMLSSPYQAFSVAATAGTLLLVIRTLALLASPAKVVQLLVCSFAAATLILIRPYQAGVLGVLLPLSVLLHNSVTRVRMAMFISEVVAASFCVLPAIAYVGWLSTQTVWHDMSRTYLMVNVTRGQIAIGFSFFWIGASIGIWRAIRDRRHEYILLILWAGISILASAILGKPMTKFADGAVLGYALLTAYGLEPLLFPESKQKEGRAVAAIARVCLCLAVGTTLLDYAKIVHSIVPEVDAEVLSIADVVRERSAGEEPPLVLMDCTQGTIFPAFSGSRVYAGHWGLTSDYRRKCDQLSMAGLSNEGKVTPTLEQLARLLNALQPKYLLTSLVSPADKWALASKQWTQIWSGQRWRLFARTR